MLVHRNHDGLEYLDRGDYIEKLNTKMKSLSKVRHTNKGRCFLHNGKTIYIKEESNEVQSYVRENNARNN